VLEYLDAKRNLVITFLIIRLNGMAKMMIEELYQNDVTEVQAIMKLFVLKNLIIKKVSISLGTY